jgi:hypothetical protein
VQQFSGKLQRFFQREQKLQTRSLDGAIFCVSANYVVYWEHWTSEAASLHGHISELPKYSTRVLLQPYAAQLVESSLTAHYPGLSGIESKSFNIIFPR